MSEFPPYHKALVARLEETGVGFNDFTSAEWKFFLTSGVVLVVIKGLPDGPDTSLMLPIATTRDLSGHIDYLKGV